MVKLLPQFSTLHHSDEFETYQIEYPLQGRFFLVKKSVPNPEWEGEASL